MAESRKSFFSSMPGFITGVAGLVSAVVAAAGLAVQQGWVGGDSGSDTAPAEELSENGKAALSGGSDDAEASGDARPEFAVQPASVSFGTVGSRDAKVTVRNTGDVDLRLETPTITGDDPDRFSVNEGTCNGVVDPGRSCELDITFAPKSGTFDAVLVVEAEDGTKAQEVPLEASAVL